MKESQVDPPNMMSPEVAGIALAQSHGEVGVF
jgi:hypothetical protein